MSRKIRILVISTLLTSSFLYLVLSNMHAGSPLRIFEENPRNDVFDRALELKNFNTTNDWKAQIMERTKKQNNINRKHSMNNTEHIGNDIEEMKLTLKNYDKKGTIFEDVHEMIQPRKSLSLLTIFTTWNQTVGNSTADLIHKNTLKNWSSFKPIFNPVVFTNDTAIAEDAEKNGWSALPIAKEADNGLPILKYMYIDAIREFRSIFYCYANSDILFDDGILNTLVHLLYKLDKETITSTPMFLTGVRWNVIKVLEHEITPRENLKSLIKTRGKVFRSDAEDYFITNAKYPWYDIPEMVVGALAFDNWLVLNAREKKHFTIDTSKTIPAVHQSYDENNVRSHKRITAKYNAILLKEIYNISIPYMKGIAYCIEKFTYFVNDTFILGDRMITQYCKLPTSRFIGPNGNQHKK